MQRLCFSTGVCLTVSSVVEEVVSASDVDWTHRQHILAVEILQRAECLFGSHSFVSPSHVITSQQRFLPGREGNGVQIDRQARRNTCDVSCNFPNSSLPTTNNSCSSHKTMSHRDGSKRWRCVTVAPFYLVSKVAGKSDRDFPFFFFFHIQACVTSSTGTRSVTSEPFSFLTIRPCDIRLFTVSDVCSDSWAFFCTHSFEPLKKNRWVSFPHWDIYLVLSKIFG